MTAMAATTICATDAALIDHCRTSTSSTVTVSPGTKSGLTALFAGFGGDSITRVLNSDGFLRFDSEGIVSIRPYRSSVSFAPEWTPCWAGLRRFLFPFCQRLLAEWFAKGRYQLPRGTIDAPFESPR